MLSLFLLLLAGAIVFGCMVHFAPEWTGEE